MDPLALGAAAGALVALLLAAAALAGVTRLRRAYDRLVPQGEHFAGVAALRAQVAGTTAELVAARADLATALRHVSVVRYDAFGDAAGQLSFSAALLDDAGDGLVLTSLTSREASRTYAKGVRNGASAQALSPEERDAVARATPRPGPS